MEVAKRIGCAVILVGHVTKEGAVAGPRVLEHLVDCVLFFEGERERSFRTLRALKNRFGATSEVGVFEMRSGGLVEVEDPSARFVAEASSAPGSVVLCSMEGTRPLLVEVQALVAPTEIVPPRRVATGSTATGWRWCSRFSPATAGRRSPAPTCSSTWPAASGSTSRAPTWPSPSRRLRAPRRAARRLVRQAAGLLRRGRADRRATPGRAPRPPRRRGGQVRARPGPRPAGRRDPRRNRGTRHPQGCGPDGARPPR